jgi:hypothetical protein
MTDIYQAALREHDTLDTAHKAAEQTARDLRSQCYEASKKILNAYTLQPYALKPGDSVTLDGEGRCVINALRCYGRDVYAVLSRWLPRQGRASQKSFFQQPVTRLAPWVEPAPKAMARRFIPDPYAVAAPGQLDPEDEQPCGTARDE